MKSWFSFFLRSGGPVLLVVGLILFLVTDGTVVHRLFLLAVVSSLAIAGSIFQFYRLKRKDLLLIAIESIKRAKRNISDVGSFDASRPIVGVVERSRNRADHVLVRLNDGESGYAVAEGRFPWRTLHESEGLSVERLRSEMAELGAKFISQGKFSDELARRYFPS
ncbi:hypothetical protein V6245_10665 [Salinibacterium amurskyense]|uniref:hypothetical protein n=1 Tax=Salinibacterium amurskyense TaxID=205941 RepID=UPI00311F37A0